jgi:hypothetical protein
MNPLFQIIRKDARNSTIIFGDKRSTPPVGIVFDLPAVPTTTQAAAIHNRLLTMHNLATISFEELVAELMTIIGACP